MESENAYLRQQVDQRERRHRKDQAIYELNIERLIKFTDSIVTNQNREKFDQLRSNLHITSNITSNTLQQQQQQQQQHQVQQQHLQQQSQQQQKSQPHIQQNIQQRNNINYYQPNTGYDQRNVYFRFYFRLNIFCKNEFPKVNLSKANPKCHFLSAMIPVPLSITRRPYHSRSNIRTSLSREQLHSNKFAQVSSILLFWNLWVFIGRKLNWKSNFEKEKKWNNFWLGICVKIYGFRVNVFLFDRLFLLSSRYFFVLRNLLCN